MDVFRVRLGPMAWPVPGTAGVAGVRGYLWVRVLGGLREVALPCSVNVRACCMGVFSVRSGPMAEACSGCSRVLLRGAFCVLSGGP